jgi:uncharacterized membrane protein
LFGELHPFVLHFAVGLLLIAPICDVLGLLLRREALLYAGRWTTLLGTFAALLSLLTGFGAVASLGPHSAAGEALLHLHKALAWIVLCIWIPVSAWRSLSKLPLPLRARTLYLASAFAGGVVLTVQAALGSALVYRHGLGLSASARAEPAVRTPAAPPSTK